MKNTTKAELLSAIRRKCMDCSGNMRNEVKQCRIVDCPLHPYRANALQAGEQVSVLDALREDA